MSTLLLVDGHSTAFRAYYGIKGNFTNHKGFHTNAIFGFFNILWHTMDEVKPEELAVCFDRHEPTFRHQRYAEYKGTRKSMDPELREQIPVLQTMLQEGGVQVLTKAGYEADDLIGTLAKSARAEGKTVMILSGDRDLLQLVEDGISVILPKAAGTEVYTPALVQEKYGVTPEGFLQMKGLMGDASDNIPGVPKIGEKTAAKIIQTFGTVENAIAHASEVKPPMASRNLTEYADQARFSLNLATICTSVPEPGTAGKVTEATFHTPEFIETLKELELRAHLSRVLKTMPGSTEFQVVEEASPFETATGSDQFTLIEEENPFDSSVDSNKKQSSAEKDETPLDIGNEKITLNESRGRNAETSFLDPNALMRNDSQKTENEKKIFSLYLCSDEENGEIYGASIGGVYIHDSIQNILKAHQTELTNPAVQKVFFDAKRLYKEASLAGIEIQGPVLDGMIAGYLLNAAQGSPSLEQIAMRYLGEYLESAEELVGSGTKKISWQMVADSKKEAFFINRERILRQVAPILEKDLQKQGMGELYQTVELPLIKVLASMEQEGIRVDTAVLDEFGEELKKGIQTLQQRIYDLAGEEFNINSTQQLGTILFDKLQLPAGKKTKKGYSTSAEVLEKLQDVPIVRDVLSYRQLSKLESTYVTGMRPFIREDGRIHCRFQQAVTATGRLSCADPNLQNIPIREELGRQLRKAFVPKNDDYIFMDADYSQIELRLVAHMSGDENMIQAYNSGADIHRLTASQVLHIPYEEVTSAQRSSAKAVNFGIIYGMSAFSLANDLGMSNQEAADYIQQYFARFPKVESFLNESVAFAKEHGYGVTLYGRRREIAEIQSKNFALRSFGERVAKNMPIQGSAADIIKIAMVRVYDRLQKEGLQSKLIVQVHDELLLEVYKPEEEKVRQILVEEMEHAASLRVPLTVEVHTGSSWLDAK